MLRNVNIENMFFFLLIIQLGYENFEVLIMIQKYRLADAQSTNFQTATNSVPKDYLEIVTKV